MKDQITCKNEIEMIIKEIVRDKMKSLKQQMDEIKKMIQEGDLGLTRKVKGTYSGAVKEKNKEKASIIKPKVHQESEDIKKTIK